jgi:F-type H+-transporting ATPase subunit gamma
MIHKKDILRTIQYLAKFKELSKAVQLVAMAQLKRLTGRIKTREFALHLACEMFDRIPFICESFVVVVITTERSCCGMLNHGVLSTSRSIIDSIVAYENPVRIVAIGFKGYRNLKFMYRNEIDTRITQVINSSLFLAYVIAECIFDSEFDKCSICFSKYITMYEQKAAYYDFVSYELFYAAIHSNRTVNMFCDMLVSNQGFDLRTFYYYNVCLVVLDAMADTLYSELGCRAVAMELAHKNSVSLLAEKVLLYNKLRQSGITNDLLEIVAGSMHM